MRFPRGYTFGVELKPGGNLDLRGVVVDAELWASIRVAATDCAGAVRLGRCWFENATLDGTAFNGIRFEGDVSFDGARFTGPASFFGAAFSGHVSFHRARFLTNVSFFEAEFRRHVCFTETSFEGDALFTGVRWEADASFQSSWFHGAADFDRARFRRDALFQDAHFRSVLSARHGRVGRHLLLDRARFRDSAWLGPLQVGGRLSLDCARAAKSLKVDASAAAVTAREAVFRTARLRLPGVAADLAGLRARDLTLEAASAVLAEATSERTALHGLRLDSCRFIAHEEGGAELGELSLHGCSFDGGGVDPGGAWTAGFHLDLAAASDCAVQARALRYRALEIRRKAGEDRWERTLLAICWATSGYGLRAGRTAATSFVLVAVLIVAIVAVASGSGHPVHHLAHHG